MTDGYGAPVGDGFGLAGAMHPGGKLGGTPGAILGAGAALRLAPRSFPAVVDTGPRQG